jgi:hypothetical protein
MAIRIGARPLVVLAASMALGGCINFSSLDDLDTAPQPATPFAQALYKDYVFLAHSFGDVGQASYTSFDQNSSIPLTETDLSVAALANAFAAKALQLAKGEPVDPEPSRDVNTHTMRDRLVRTLAAGRDSFPRDAARAQADWDCWRLNDRSSTQATAAEQCRRSFEVTLPRLETEVASLPKPAAPAEPKPGTQQQPAGEQPDSAETP